MASGEASRRDSPFALLSPFPSDGLDRGCCRCGLADGRKPGVLRGEPVRPVFRGDRAIGGGKYDPRLLFRKSAGPGPLPITKRNHR